MSTTQSLQSLVKQLQVVPNSFPTVWASLIPCSDLYDRSDLTNVSVYIGRSPDCEISVANHNIARISQQTNSRGAMAAAAYRAISNRHFLLERDCLDETIAYITDMSMNGTYLNGDRIKKNVRTVISSGDEIAVCLPRYGMFTFVQYLKAGDIVDSKVILDCSDIRKDYVVSKMVGKGAYGEVRLIIRKSDCAKFALKIVKRKQFPGHKHKRQANLLNKEVEILKLISHPCIVSIQNVYQSDARIFMVLDFVGGGELFDKLVSLKSLSEKYAKHVFYQVALAVDYLHHHNITHRDIKPENILLADSLSETTLVKVTDFGLSKCIGSRSVMRTYCGTPTYLAPEIIKSNGNGTYTKNIDVWSMGVVLYVCLSGECPFPDSDSRSDAEHSSDNQNKDPLKGHDIRRYEDAFAAAPWRGVSKEAKDLITQMMDINPSTRPSSRDVLSSPWLVDDHEMITIVQSIIGKASCIPAKSITISATATGIKRKAAKMDDCKRSHSSPVGKPRLDS